MNMIDENIVPEINYLVFRKCTPSWRIKPDLIDFYDITYVTKGSALYTIDGKSCVIGEGDILCIPPGHTRSAAPIPDSDDLMQCFALNFSVSTINGTPVRLPFPLVFPLGIRKDLVRYCHELTMAWVEKEPGCLIKTRGLLLLILHLLFEHIVYNVDSSNRDYRVKKICRYIATHYAEKFSVRKAAELTGLNPVYFGALFHQETGLTLHQYIARIRVRNGENMLRSGEYKVSEAAEYCGYADVFYFYKQFKRILGYAPSACIPKRSGGV
ncbi:MAG: AraC family transcriptional regulator [Spirochaetaceae bacterium]|jgi:AraC-like DNA-binding protein|nr:AraC family transcriptional regulator [Spirochaetaceae bacterium]